VALRGPGGRSRGPGRGLGGLGGGFGSAPRQDVGTKIRITPHINDSNEVRLEIDEEISEVGASGRSARRGDHQPRTAKTVVMVRDQNTVVIGGLIRHGHHQRDRRCPSWATSRSSGRSSAAPRATQRTNLLLFLTPYVIRDQSDLRRIFERKMRERQEFLDRYFVFSGTTTSRPSTTRARVACWPR
jgi:general secretion pathway protein D